MKEEARVNRIIEQRQIVVYKPSEKVKMEVKTDGETVWLTIEQMAQLLGRDPSVIGKHIKGAFGEGEADERINRQILPGARSRGKATSRSPSSAAMPGWRDKRRYMFQLTDLEMKILILLFFQQTRKVK